MDDRDFGASESARLGLVHKSMLESMEADGAIIWCRELMEIRETVRRQWLPDWPLSNLKEVTSSLCLGQTVCARLQSVGPVL